MSKAFAALMPVHHELMEVAAAHVVQDAIADDYAGELFAPRPATPDPVFALQGQPRLVAIAQVDRNLALTLNRLIDQLSEADFAEAALTSDELSHRIRTNYLASRSDASGVAAR